MKDYPQTTRSQFAIIFLFILIYFPLFAVSGGVSDSDYEIQIRNLDDLESDFQRLIGEVKDILPYKDKLDVTVDDDIVISFQKPSKNNSALSQDECVTDQNPKNINVLESDKHTDTNNELFSQSKSDSDDINYHYHSAEISSLNDDIHPSIEPNDLPFEFVESLNYDQFENEPEHRYCLNVEPIACEQSCYPSRLSTKCRDHDFAYFMASFGDRPFFDGSLYTLGFMLFEDFFSTDKLTLFFDLNGSYYDYSGKGLSAGLGFRYNFPCTTKIFGFNAYFDYFDTSNFSLRQASIGLEWFDCFFEFRSNVYFPIGKEMSHAKHFLYDDYIGDYIVEADLWVKSLKGIDLEIGRTFNFCNGVYFYPFIGGYYFSANSCKNVGLSGGVRLSLLPYFSVEARGFCDKCNYTKGECSITINLPFEIFSGRCCNSRCLDKRYQPVYRKNYIPHDKRCVYETNY